MMRAQAIKAQDTLDTPFTVIEGMSTIAERYDFFILDIFGVIHDGVEPFAGTQRCLRELQKAGKQVCLLSNTPRRAEGTKLSMEYMDLPRDLYNHVVTSGEATHEYLRKNLHNLGRKCWLIGEADARSPLPGLDLELVKRVEDADFILNAIPATENAGRHVLIEALHVAQERGINMICANPDLVVNIASEQYECAGTFAKIYENMGGYVTYIGKPHAPVYEQCYEFFGRPDKSRILAVGDSLHTDITGAHGFGIDCCFNLTGIHWEEVAMSVAPDISDSTKITALLGRHAIHPTYITEGFQWS